MKITTPINPKSLESLKCGEKVYISGYIYTARDLAHKRLVKLLKNGKELPFNLKNQIIYYVGPAPAKPGDIIGPCGPTTSYRMDDYTPILLEHGLKAMIGKGPRNKKVKEAIKKNKAIYFAAVGGTAALLSKCVKSAELIAYEDLGTEAIRKLYVEDFPVFVVNDTYGNDLYETTCL
ncbi:fumarate hydratase subunit beta [Hypnocyclicus thermotrophus]|uniref:Fumarate hydratase subunit beta n=1 Tax=Hypnocyclicus thermotrophus TaxID=1627895 RepID=A0AA46DZR5_9FUSO|nr:Fe-S-containing hydro-lyase [Hypnocyclicus thermotrophus]TDT71859.1 fumarate hydratase subunit beta [Hypnocyclicus thermotrophus]